MQTYLRLHIGTHDVYSAVWWDEKLDTRIFNEPAPLYPECSEEVISSNLVYRHYH